MFKFLKLSRVKLACFKDHREKPFQVSHSHLSSKVLKDIDKPKTVNLVTQTKSAEQGGDEHQWARFKLSF